MVRGLASQCVNHHSPLFLQLTAAWLTETFETELGKMLQVTYMDNIASNNFFYSYFHNS